MLPAMALELIRARPRCANPYVFAGRGDSHFSGYSKGKRALDARATHPPAMAAARPPPHCQELNKSRQCPPGYCGASLGHAIRELKAFMTGTLSKGEISRAECPRWFDGIDTGSPGRQGASAQGLAIKSQNVAQTFFASAVSVIFRFV